VDGEHVLYAAGGNASVESPVGRVTRTVVASSVPSYQWALLVPADNGEIAAGSASSLSMAKRHVERNVEAAGALLTDQAFVYVLATIDGGRTYVGWTTDVERRLEAHNSGRGARATRGRRWRLVHVEVFRTRRLAMAREVELKRDRRFRHRLASQLDA